MDNLKHRGRDQKVKCDVLIIGCGPAGSGAAKALAQNGKKVLVVEKKPVIGSPVECGEAISQEWEKYYPDLVIPKRAINQLQKGTIFWVNKEIKVQNNSEIWKSMSVDRNILDKELALQAADAGAKIIVGAEFVDVEKEGKFIKKAYIKCNRFDLEVMAKIFISAEGCYPKMAEIQNRKSISEWEIGKTASYEMTNLKLLDPERIQMFFDDTSLGGYGYIIPKSKNTANVGLGRLGIRDKPWDSLDKFIYDNPIVEKQIRNAGVVQLKIGETPITGPTLESVIENVIYVGDAGGHNLSHVGEGAIPSYLCGLVAGRIATQALNKENIEILKELPLEISKEKVGKEINSTAAVRDAIVKIYSSNLPIETKLRIGGLLVSEVIPPVETQVIGELPQLTVDEIVDKAKEIIKKYKMNASIEKIKL